MANKTNILDKAQIEATIKRILTNGKKLDADIQAAGVGCLDHIEKHGDVTLFNRLYLAMPLGARKSAMTAWAIAFGRVAANTGDNKKEAPFVYDKAKASNIVDAIANPWYNFSPDKLPDEVFDVRKALTQLVARASKSPSVNDAELFTKVRELVEASE